MKPCRNPQYLAWIRTLPCLVCGSRAGVEASHTGPHGLGQKSSDLSAVPLCYRHHRTSHDSYHKMGARRFVRAHQLDLPAIVRLLNERPVIRVEEGAVVGYLNGQRFVLGRVQDGIARAVNKMLNLSRECRSIPPIAS